MESFCGRYVIVFNGEIYNFQEIRKQLEGQGVVFRGRSDTEVALAAISLWGLRKALSCFVGMFAFALWDKIEHNLILVRDRMGEKPLYYGMLGSTFFFGSELKTMKPHPEWKGIIDRGALSLFMRHNYIPSPHSIYEGIRKLPPATMLVVNLDDLSKHSGLPAPEEYWSIRRVMEEGVTTPFNRDAEEIAQQLEELLVNAIAGQMVADVPLGAFLSGGIDSSTVVAIMQSLSCRPVKTFSIGFYEEKYNEADYAKAVASHIGTEHSELYVTSAEAIEVIPKLSMLYDEPFADSSQIPTFLVSQLARQSVTVSLSGDGGDELFAGYGRYLLLNKRWNQLQRIPPFLLSFIGIPLLNRMFAHGNPFGNTFLQGKVAIKVQRILEILKSPTPESFYNASVSHWINPCTFVMTDKEPISPITNPANVLKKSNLIHRLQYLDMISYLPDDILVKVDRAAMGVSLESRVPFLDHRVVEFAARIPLAMKLEGNSGKMILRKVLNKYVPKELLERPKRGFAVPIAEWLRGPLSEWASDLLNPTLIDREGILYSESIRKKWLAHLSGKEDWSGLLWNFLMFQAWLENEKKI